MVQLPRRMVEHRIIHQEHYDASLQHSARYVRRSVRAVYKYALDGQETEKQVPLASISHNEISQNTVQDFKMLFTRVILALALAAIGTASPMIVANDDYQHAIKDTADVVVHIHLPGKAPLAVADLCGFLTPRLIASTAYNVFGPGDCVSNGGEPQYQIDSALISSLMFPSLDPCSRNSHCCSGYCRVPSGTVGTCATGE